MPRNIVVCLDGTWNDNEKQNTNVHRLYGMLDRSKCVANYWSGVGVGGRALSNALDAATGRGAFRIMRSAFTFVKGNYTSGDRIYIFGFSRGAFTARHLAGMVVRLGLGQFAEETYDAYITQITSRQVASSTRQEVHFLGLFDCVPGNQIYLLRKYLRALNGPVLEPGIRHFAHAVSRAERRWSFAPILFANGDQATFQQRWFPGYHFDLGGDSNPPLNGFALWWMLREAYGQGLEFELIKCPGQEAPSVCHHGKLGIKIGFMGCIDSAAPGRSSDWVTTSLGLRKPRAGLAGVERVSEQPDLADLDECPRGCGEDMFEFFLTPEGSRRLAALREKLGANHS